MGIYRDLIDVAKDVKDFATSKPGGSKLFKKKQPYSSIADMASEGTLQFPTLVSASLDVDTLQMVCKALEREYATYVQVSLYLNQIVDGGTYSSIPEYLKSFHQNSDLKERPAEIGRGVNNLVGAQLTDSATRFDSIYETDDYSIISVMYEGASTKLVANNKEQLTDLLHGVRKDLLNDKFIPRKDVIYNFKNPELNQKYNSVVTEAKGGKGRKYRRNRGNGNNNNNTPGTNSMAPVHYDVARGQKTYIPRNTNTNVPNTPPPVSPKKNVVRTIKKNDKKSIDNNIDTNITNTTPPNNVQNKNFVLPNNILKDNDVKKANELVATTMQIRLRIDPKNGSNAYDTDFILAVKSTMHPIKSTEMISNMVSACKNNNKIFNFLRWTTGEISFFKDFLFGISEIKGDISQRSAGSSPWWISLKRRARLAKVSHAAFKNSILPNTTIVMSADEVEYIRSEYGYDLMNPIFVDKIMETYYLLGFVVVDMSSQLVHFKFENNQSFQTVTFSGLEKENGADSRKFKEMLKFINRN